MVYRTNISTLELAEKYIAEFEKDYKSYEPSLSSTDVQIILTIY